jgi:hypothetical protein
MEGHPSMSQGSKSQDYDGSSFSGSSASGMSRNTWSSHTGGLVQIGSFKFAQSTQDDLSMGEDSNHRFSVIIHDNTNVDSLAEAASSGLIENPHRVEDPEIVPRAKRGVKVFGRLKSLVASKNDESRNSSFKKENEVKVHHMPRRESPLEDKDAFDQCCTTFEGFVCRNGNVGTVQLEPVKGRKVQQVVESTFVYPTETENPREEDRDALDTVFEEVESMTCGPGTKLNSRKAVPGPSYHEPVERKHAVVDNRDALERVFDGVEIMTCGPDSSHQVETFKRYGTKKTKNKKSKKSFNTDILDRMCESVEHYTCRLNASNSRFSQERDLLDKVFDSVESASCSQKTPKIGNMTNKDAPLRAENPIQVPVEKQMIKLSGQKDDVEYAIHRNDSAESQERYDNDLLDRIFEQECADANDDHQSVNENSMVASAESESIASSRDIDVREEPYSQKQRDRDLLDFIFETVESKTCRPNDDDIAIVKRRSDSKRSDKRLWGNFLFSRN